MVPSNRPTTLLLIAIALPLIGGLKTETVNPPNAVSRHHHAKPRMSMQLMAAAQKKAAAPSGIILLCCLLAFATDSNNAMSGSFFATHFTERGVDTATLGLTLGASSGAGLLMAAPLTARLIQRFGATRTMLASALLYATCRFCLASLYSVRDPRTLVACAFCALAVQAFADATCDVAASTTVLTTVAVEQRTQAQGTFLALRSIGSLIAPPIGGYLYLAGGFAAPFVAFGVVLVLACLPVLRLVLAAPPHAPAPPAAADQRSITSFWKVRRVMMTMVAMALCLPFPAAYWAPFLKGAPYHLNEAKIGLAMMLATVFFTGSSVLSATLERAVGGVTMLGLGTAATGLSVFLTSSLWPFTRLPRHVAVPVVGMCATYGAIGLIFAAANPLCVKLAEAEGMSAEAAASQVTSLWVLAFAVAGSAAPPMGGLVAQRAGPRAAQTICGSLALLATLPLVGLAAPA